MAGTFKFTFGPWNIHEGADPFGPTVRDSISFGKKLAEFKKLGFEGVQFHDDDAVPDMNELSPLQIIGKAKELKKVLDDNGLVAEFVAPRLWEDPRTIDGGYTSNDPACRQFALDRSKRTIDIANALGTDLIVLWLAREGTYIREAKDSKVATERIVEAINVMQAYDTKVRICIEPKPNEPMDHTYIPTTGHAIALSLLCDDPKRVGVNIESAHAVLAGLDPSDEMGYALAFDKLWTVHLNDQNGLKFDQDKTFGSVDLRRAFNQVRILDKHNYGQNGEFVGLDVKAMRSQKDDIATKHLSNSKVIFMKLLEISRSIDESFIEKCRQERDYEELDLYIMKSLLGS
ncbi:TIM barrel protein [uncultured Draconibacterium sp.]|uniref:TIM barrel protein n=1 Tax=uncultured Draconibacterium sp. TaxID=1573823 RepID=UPI0029C7AB3A|nr:TIM barrel protein [uncultured Draconibacterium sp.]